MQLFYVPNVQDEFIVLDPVESKHVVKVLRLTEGNKVHVVDGKGGFYDAEITDANPKGCTLKITSSQQNFGKRNSRLHIAIAPTKNNDRLEWFLEKATEVGIDEITPMLCVHSERKALKNERLEKILTAAMKQSLKAYIPLLNELQSFEKILDLPFNGKRFIAHCHTGDKIHLKNALQPGEDALILIGPEGDFSPEEVDKAIQAGFIAISLGSSRLRTETAGVAACMIANLINE